MPSRLRYSLLICLSAGFAAHAFAADKDSALPPAVSDPHFQLAPGYLKQTNLPDSLQLLGPPPTVGSPSLARDEQAGQATLPLRGTARWELARTDADLSFPQPAKNFSCAMGLQIDATTTPHLYTLMQRILTDAGLSTYGVKDKYQRTRPFVIHNEGTCRPDQEALLRNDGSYPSGHTAAGWAWALVLAEIHPQRANTLLSRGISFGQSRVICNAHWQSDVDAGRIMGAATVARLHADPTFLADLELARKEVIAATAQHPAMECSSETAALSGTP
ncbi:acid phosphatase [Bordetella holmesii]|uniref:Acid phosphatase n=2 Tax=Bordetella holmesii TaxID=35814 RepID=A0A158M4S1_9BORD|nr:phosphatase PAP2 family protein [Bordetella holmesii]AIT28445.1 acid phosphatase [Bordetella holmesii 44057]EWM41237.1 acid phosphatase [Bordetella holmesii 35009]EWM43326.1 acid phosphatase [Bordetella holmesii 41130]EWM45128.1 acid phosphatase [Bordetella holmesii 70147]AMD47106.1 acid phosphatase [Bordetella holmesii H558]